MKKQFAFLFSYYLALILFFVLTKPLFLWHYMEKGAYGVTDFFRVIGHGLKLDSTVAAYLTAFPLLVVMVSVWWNRKELRLVIRGYWVVVAVLLAVIFCADFALYDYWKFRLDATVLFYLNSPTNAAASVTTLQIIFWTVMTIVVFLLIYSGLRRFKLPLYTKKGLLSRFIATGSYILLGGVLFLLMRGGVTTSTANVGRVYHSPDNFLNHAAINPVFSLLASISKSDDYSTQFCFFDDAGRDELFSGLFPPVPDSVQNRSVLTTDRPDILIILLESFSANVIQSVGGMPGVTPELDKLSREGILFRQTYASSFRTDRGLVAALSGYPGQPTTSIMKIPSKSQTLPSISKSLVKEGYTTDVLYGGDINFTNMRSYFLSSGYSKVVSDVNFPLSQRLSKWGAQDDVTFRYLYEHMKSRGKQDTPRMTTFLTQSSHEPFEVPYHKWEDPYLNSVAFVDSCLGEFVAKIKKEPVWDNLLIVLVSDHGYRYPSNLFEYAPERFHIPMLWLGGAVKEPLTIEEYVAQTDLAATLLAQLNIATDEFTFSRNIFRPSGVDPFAFYTFNNGFGFLDSTGKTVFDNAGDLILLEEVVHPNDNRLEKGKAILQTLYQDLGSR